MLVCAWLVFLVEEDDQPWYSYPALIFVSVLWERLCDCVCVWCVERAKEANMVAPDLERLNMVLLGVPGAGKSTILRQLKLRHCASDKDSLRSNPQTGVLESVNFTWNLAVFGEVRNKTVACTCTVAVGREQEQLRWAHGNAENIDLIIIVAPMSDFDRTQPDGSNTLERHFQLMKSVFEADLKHVLAAAADDDDDAAVTTTTHIPVLVVMSKSVRVFWWKGRC